LINTVPRRPTDQLEELASKERSDPVSAAVCAREFVDPLDLGAGTEQVQSALLPFLWRLVTGPSDDQVESGAPKERVRLAQRSEYFNQRSLIGPQAREHCVRRYKHS
jgi:hypothetical protein